MKMSTRRSIGDTLHNFAALLILTAAACSVVVAVDISDLPIGGPILEVPENLRRKPTDNDGLKQEINLHRELANETKYLDDSLTLYCDIVGTPVPSYRWLKNDASIPSKHMRMITKVELYGAQLSIDQLTESDSGWYSCIGSNPAGVRRTTAYVTVMPTKRKKKGKRKRPKDEGDTDAGAAVGDGFCQRFKPTVCSGFLGGQEVFVPSNVYQYNKESQLVQLLQRMLDIVNETCMQPLTEAVCRFNFPTCYRIVGGAAPRPKRLCQRDCTLVTWHACQEDFEKLRSSLDYFQQQMRPDIDYPSLLPDCESLPTESCVGLKAAAVARPPPLPSPLPPPPPPPPSPPTPPKPDCYNDTGARYRGTLAITRSARPCLHWGFIPGYGTVGSHNWCRNPEPLRFQAPWCFVTSAGAREECDLKQCPSNSGPGDAFRVNRDGPEVVTNGHRNDPGQVQPTGGVVSIREMVPVFVSLGVLAILAVVLSIVCCVYRRTTAAGAAAAAAATAGDSLYPGMAGKAIKLTVKQSASDLLLDQQCRAPLLAQEFPLTQMRFGDDFGESVFGKVYKGELIGLYTETSLTPVAIKCLNASADSNLQAEFRAEIQRLAGLSHPNLLRLLGVSVRQTPCCLALELLPHGDLHEFLTFRSPNCDHSGDYHDPLSHGQMLHIATQVASAVEYLATRCLVHRDVAARNVLLGENLQCKLTDLGQCRDTYSQDYYRLRGCSRLPIRWMPPEAILYGQFAPPSDVYSLGVLLWEIWSYGLQPYYGYSNSEVIDLVRQRQLLARPQDCPDRVYSLMLDCWAEPANHRVPAGGMHDRLRQWQSELLVELSTSSQGSGHTNSTCFSDPRPASQRVIPVPVPQLSPPDSSSGSGRSTAAAAAAYSGGAPGLHGHGYLHPRMHGVTLHVPISAASQHQAAV